MSRSIEQIVESLKHAKERSGTGGVLLVGAGCSVTAGIPMASDFVEEIRLNHPAAYAAASTKTYPECMAALVPGVRQTLISQYVDNATRINWAHVCIAALLKHGFVDRILTTNFDNLIVRACALLGEFPAVYDMAVSPAFKATVIPTKAIFHLHGQHTGFVMKNTLEEVATQKEVLRPVFDEIGKKRPWIVVGYSGLNDPVFQLLAEVPVFEYGLDWVGYEDRDPDEHVRAELLDDSRYAYYLRGYDADGFFSTLAQQLAIFPPAVVTRPFSYMQELLGKLTEWRSPGHNARQNVVGPALDLIASAIRLFEEPGAGASDGNAGVSPADGATEVRSAREIFNLQLAADFRGVLRAAHALDEPAREKVKDAIAWAHTAEGDELRARAGSVPQEEALRLLEGAKRAYDEALGLKPDLTVAFNGKGDTLTELAKLRDFDQQYTLTTLQHAAETYRAGLQTNPCDVHALNRCGMVLIRAARHPDVPAPEADTLLAEAASHFETALENLPGAGFLLNNWGEALFERARRSREPETLLAEAADKHRQALESRPNDAYALERWGNCLHERGIVARERHNDEEAMSNFAAAAEKFKQAHETNRNSVYALNHWGLALFEWGRLQRREEAIRKLQDAEEKHRLAGELDPNDWFSLERQALALLELGWRTSPHEAEQYFHQAAQIFEAGLRKRPGFPQWLNDLGRALFELGRLHDGAEAERYYVEAAERHREAYEHNPRDRYALDNWGKVLLERARLHGDEEGESLLAEAVKKHRRSLELDPENVYALCQWGDVLFERAKRAKQRSEAEPFLAEAVDRYQKAFKIDPTFDRARDSLEGLAAWAADRKGWTGNGELPVESLPAGGARENRRAVPLGGLTFEGDGAAG